MKEDPPITIYIPTYNRAAILRQALTCLRLQTLSKDGFRVVVADNASPDGTESVVGEFSDLNIIYLKREQNLGAFGNASGAAEFFDTRYFHFLSDDDLIAPWHLEYVLSRLERDPAIGVFGTASHIGEGLWSRDLLRADLRLGDNYIDWTDQLRHWSREQWLAAHSIASAVCINSTLFRTKLLKDISPLFDPDVPEIIGDRWLMARVGARTTCVTSPWASCTVRVLGGNMVHGRSDLHADGTILNAARLVAVRVLKLAQENGYDLAGFWRSYLEKDGRDRNDIRNLIYMYYPPGVAEKALATSKPPPGVGKAQARIFRSQGLAALVQGRRREARQCFMMALRYRPLHLKTALRLARTFLPAPLANALSGRARKVKLQH